ncbi:MAG: polysaccharide deacetylase family protein [Deltaproteobacteria bacterium]|nr:polysaccharide deacetylase family protein [Deltaproteobacteria bacterium]
MKDGIFSWPNGSRIAVLVTVMFESWSEGKAPPYSPMTSPLREGTPDLIGVSWSEYGGRTGIWRIMRLLDEFGVRSTVCVSGRSVELFAEAVRELHQKGHELAGHGYTQDGFLPYLSPEDERATIRRCLALLEGATGVRPVGWFSPRATPTPHTAALLAEEGCLWHGDYNDIPHSDFTDNRTLRSSPRVFYQVYKDTFDFLYRTERTGMINLTFHAHFGGRPLMSAMVAEILRYMKGFSEVWFPRHDEVAQWVLKGSGGEFSP